MSRIRDNESPEIPKKAPANLGKPLLGKKKAERVSGGFAERAVPRKGRREIFGFLRDDEVFADDPQDHPDTVCDPQLRIYSLQVRLHRIHRDAEFVCNGAVPLFIENEPHDLGLAPREFQALGDRLPVFLAEL